MISVSFLLIAVPFAYSHSVLDTGMMPKFLALMIGSIFVVLSWLRMELRGEAFRVSLPTDLPIFLFLLIVVLQWPRAYDVYQASIEVIKVFTFTAIYVAITRCSVPGHWRIWTSVLAIVGTVVSGIGICQYLDVGFLWLPSAGLPSATFAYRNTAAMFIIIALPFAVLKFALAKAWRSEICWAVGSTVMVIFLIYSRTRGAWVGGVVSTVVVLLIAGLLLRKKRVFKMEGLSSTYLRKSFTFLVSLIVIVASSSVSPSEMTLSRQQASRIPEEKGSAKKTLDSVISSVSSIPSGKTLSRGRVWWWRSTLRMMQDFPLSGVGLGNWEKVYPQYRYADLYVFSNRVPRRPHNDYLWIGSELGLPGLLIYLCIFLFGASAIFSSVPSMKSGSLGFLLAAIAGIVAIQTHALVSFPRERIGPMLGEWFCIALLAAVCRTIRSSRKDPWRIGAAAGSAVVVLVGSVVVTAAAVSETATAAAVGIYSHDKATAANLLDTSARLGVFDYRQLMYHTQVYAGAGRPEAAWAAGHEVMRRNPNSSSAIRNLGEVATGLAATYERNGDSDDAIQVYESLKAYTLDEDPWILFQIGQILYRRGDFAQALERYKEVLALQDSYTSAHMSMGNSYLALGSRSEAIHSYLKGLSLDPNNALAHYAVAKLYISQSEPSRAIGHLQEALRLTKNPRLIQEIENLLQELET